MSMTLILAATIAAVTPPPVNATCSGPGGVPSPRIIVQGGAPVRGEVSPAIGPKQDDPVGGGGRGGVASGVGKGGDPRTIGPKQDDPVGGGGRGSMALNSGKGGGDPRTIGPKHDDPSPQPPQACAAAASTRQG